MKRLNIYSSKIPSTFSNINSAVKDIIYFLQDTYGVLDESIIFDLKVALNELVSNAVKHGNKEDNQKSVKIIAGIAKNEYAFFLIEDEGTGYDYKCLLERNEKNCECSDVFDLKETGRGLWIVKNLCDEIRFNKTGNKVIVLKKLSKD